MRAIHPKKKQPLRPLSLEDQQFNQALSSDRINVENYFGRLSSLWAVFSQKYRWNEESYNMIFRIGMALTSFHITIHPLRADDHHFFEIMRRRLYTMGEES